MGYGGNEDFRHGRGFSRAREWILTMYVYICMCTYICCLGARFYAKDIYLQRRWDGCWYLTRYLSR